MVTSKVKLFFQTTQDQERGMNGPASLLHSWHWVLFYNKFWFFLICPSRALSEFQVSDRKVPCFNRRSRQCELDSIMLFCIDNDRFPQSAKICFKYLHQIFESEVANGGNRHFPFKTHTQSILLGVSECLGKDFIFADVRGISKSAYVFLFAPFNIIPSLWVNWN